jgi:hypothetical protein
MIFCVATFLLLATSLCLASDETLSCDRSRTVERKKLNKKSKKKSKKTSKKRSQDHVEELKAAGLFKHLGQFPSSEVPAYTDSLGFTKFTWDTQINVPEPSINGPSCILGTEYFAYSRPADKGKLDNGRESDKLLIFLQGGGGK